VDVAHTTEQERVKAAFQESTLAYEAWRREEYVLKCIDYHEA